MENLITHPSETREESMVDASDDRLYRADRFDPQSSVGNLLRLAYGSLQAQIDRHMEPHGLTAMQWQPLAIIASGDAVTAADLSRLMQVDTGATTRMLDRLAAKGLITRERNMTDRRLIKLSLTEAGQRIAQAIPESLCTALNAHLTGFKREDLDTLNSLLQRLIDNGHDLSDRSRS